MLSCWRYNIIVSLRCWPQKGTDDREESAKRKRRTLHNKPSGHTVLPKLVWDSWRWVFESPITWRQEYMQRCKTVSVGRWLWVVRRGRLKWINRSYSATGRRRTRLTWMMAGRRSSRWCDVHGSSASQTRPMVETEATLECIKNIRDAVIDRPAVVGQTDIQAHMDSLDTNKQTDRETATENRQKNNMCPDTNGHDQI